MLFSYIWCLFLIPVILGGTPCPPRLSIYPCSCANVRLSKSRYYTIVTCHKIDNSDSLETVFTQLRSMQIDQFHMLDSYWPAHALGELGVNKTNLPENWMTLMRMKEIEISDTTLAPCFACQPTLPCRNTVTTRFKISNISTSENICTLCNAETGSYKSWTGCMQNLEEFTFNYGRLTVLGEEFFPLLMKELKLLNLSYHQIQLVDRNALKNLPNLTTLDLSHNSIQTFDQMFRDHARKLKYLDVSFNFIKAIGPNLFVSLPHLRTLKASNNDLFEMKDSEWRSAPSTLIHIDLTENRFRCDCSVRWINSTFNTNTDLQGTCYSPEEYQNTPIRRASRFLLERCNSAGVMGTRRPSRRPPTGRSSSRSRTTY